VRNASRQWRAIRTRCDDTALGPGAFSDIVARRLAALDTVIART